MEKEKESKNILPNFLEKLSLKQRDQLKRDQLKIEIPKNNIDSKVYQLSLKQRQQLGIRYLQ